VAEAPESPHTVTAVMRLAGRQKATMAVQHGGTPEAYVSVAVGRSVIYMHTRATAERFGEIWRGAQPYALHLPRARELRGPDMTPPDIAQPSVVVHTAGQPAASVRLGRSVPRHVSLTIGGLAFLIYDQQAFASCAEPFLRAADAGRELLGEADLRLAPAMRTEPALAGEDAERAAATLRLPAHPAALAAVAFPARSAGLSPRADQANRSNLGQRVPAARRGRTKARGPERSR
jgi:hypothetical protein